VLSFACWGRLSKASLYGTVMALAPMWAAIAKGGFGGPIVGPAKRSFRLAWHGRSMVDRTDAIEPSGPAQTL